MSLEPSQTSAKTSLLASPQMATDAGQQPQFDIVARGYHREQVNQWLDWAKKEIERLGRLAGSFAGHELATPQGRKLMVEVIQIAADELAGQKAAADAEIAQLIAGAREQAEQILAEARAQADHSNASAADQAKSLVEGARTEAKRMTDEAAAHSAAVHEAAGARLAQFVQFHEDGLVRIREVNKKTGEILAKDAERGSLGDEVSRALLPVRGLTLQGELTLDEGEKRHVEETARHLKEADQHRTWGDCEEQAAKEFATEKLSAAGFVVEEAELL